MNESNNNTTMINTMASTSATTAVLASTTPTPMLPMSASSSTNLLAATTDSHDLLPTTSAQSTPSAGSAQATYVQSSVLTTFLNNYRFDPPPNGLLSDTRTPFSNKYTDFEIWLNGSLKKLFSDYAHVFGVPLSETNLAFLDDIKKPKYPEPKKSNASTALHADIQPTIEAAVAKIAGYVTHRKNNNKGRANDQYLMFCYFLEDSIYSIGAVGEVNVGNIHAAENKVSYIVQRLRLIIAYQHFPSENRGIDSIYTMIHDLMHMLSLINDFVLDMRDEISAKEVLKEIGQKINLSMMPQFHYLIFLLSPEVGSNVDFNFYNHLIGSATDINGKTHNDVLFYLLETCVFASGYHESLKLKRGYLDNFRGLETSKSISLPALNQDLSNPFVENGQTNKSLIECIEKLPDETKLKIGIHKDFFDNKSIFDNVIKFMGYLCIISGIIPALRNMASLGGDTGKFGLLFVYRDQISIYLKNFLEFNRALNQLSATIDRQLDQAYRSYMIDHDQQQPPWYPNVNRAQLELTKAKDHLHQAEVLSHEVFRCMNEMTLRAFKEQVKDKHAKVTKDTIKLLNSMQQLGISQVEHLPLEPTQQAPDTAASAPLLMGSATASTRMPVNSTKSLHELLTTRNQTESLLKLYMTDADLTMACSQGQYTGYNALQIAVMTLNIVALRAMADYFAAKHKQAEFTKLINSEFNKIGTLLDLLIVQQKWIIESNIAWDNFTTESQAGEILKFLRQHQGISNILTRYLFELTVVAEPVKADLEGRLPKEVNLLLLNGANANAPYQSPGIYQSLTPLYIVADKGLIGWVTVLLSYGADSQIKIRGGDDTVVTKLTKLLAAKREQRKKIQDIPASTRKKWQENLLHPDQDEQALEQAWREIITTIERHVSVNRTTKLTLK